MYLKFSSVLGIWSCWLSGPGKQHLFSIFSRFPPNIWIISGSSLDVGQKPCHYHPIQSGVLTSLLLQGRSVYLHTFHCLFSDQICARKQRPFLVCFALWSPVRWWAGLSTWMHSVPCSFPRTHQEPLPLNHESFSNFLNNHSSFQYSNPLHSHTHVHGGESQNI